MVKLNCPRCGAEFDEPIGGVRTLLLSAESGNLYLAGPEHPVHRCPGLTRADEGMLLADAQLILDHEPFDAEE